MQNNFRRHVGRLKNTGDRVVVVFMQIPGKEDHALVISTTGLPARLEQYLTQVVESAEGQQNENLGVVLGRRVTPDTNESLLNAFHNQGYLQRVHIDNVLMYPNPSQGYPLREILVNQGRNIPDTNAPVPITQDVASFYAKDTSSAAAPVTPDYGNPSGYDVQAEYNPFAANRDAAERERKVQLAQNLLLEAAHLQATVDAKREEAYRQAPELRPAPAPAPIQYSGDLLVAQTQSAPKVTKAKATPAKAPAKTTQAKSSPKARGNKA